MSRICRHPLSWIWIQRLLVEHWCHYTNHQPDHRGYLHSDCNQLQRLYGHGIASGNHHIKPSTQHHRYIHRLSRQCSHLDGNVRVHFLSMEHRCHHADHQPNHCRKLYGNGNGNGWLHGNQIAIGNSEYKSHTDHHRHHHYLPKQFHNADGHGRIQYLFLEYWSNHRRYHGYTKCHQQLYGDRH